MNDAQRRNLVKIEIEKLKGTIDKSLNFLIQELEPFSENSFMDDKTKKLVDSLKEVENLITVLRRK